MGPFWYSPLGEYYCHRHSSDSCRRNFNLVSLICRLWNALATSGSSVHVYRFSTIFATDRVWFGCMSMYSSWKRQLLLCESCFAEALELPLESFCVPTMHNPDVNMCPFAESSFWYQALQLFRILSLWQEILTNPTVDSYISKLLKWKFYQLTVILHKDLRLGHIIAQSTGLNSILIHSHMKSLRRFHLQKYIQSTLGGLPIAPICHESKFWCKGMTSFIHWHVKYISSKQN